MAAIHTYVPDCFILQVPKLSLNKGCNNKSIQRAERMNISNRITIALLITLQLFLIQNSEAQDTLLAGTGKVDVTDYDAGPVNDPLYVKALVLKNQETTAVLLSVDAVSIGEIGRIGNDFLPGLRKQLKDELGISGQHVLINASHCHGVIQRKGLEEKTTTAIRRAIERLEPVKVGMGTGKQDKIQENRRLILKSGKVIDVRHAYSLPSDDEVESVGPIDPQIGILRLDRLDGSTLAIVYNFACHPIQSVPNGSNTADLVGYASKAIEGSFGENTMAIFIQGCGGDINPVNYKDVHHPRHAETLGNKLGLSTIHASRKIKCRQTSELQVLNETIKLPRGDRVKRIRELETEKERLVNSFRGTSLNLKNFLNLLVKYNISPDFPSANAHRYLQEKLLGDDNLQSLDKENLRNIKAYLRNIQTMEQLTRVKTNLALLKKHQAEMIESGSRTIDVEIAALRIGDFRLITFPGELTVQIGLNLKKKSPYKPSFVAGYTNGYIYYAPTAEQMTNLGGAQEDSDCLLAPTWQQQFELKAIEMLKKLE